MRSDLIVDILDTVPFPKKGLFKNQQWFRIEMGCLRYACYMWSVETEEWTLRQTKRILWHCMVDPQNLPHWVNPLDKRRYVDIYKRAKNDGRCAKSDGGRYVTYMKQVNGSGWWQVQEDPPKEKLGVSFQTHGFIHVHNK